MNIRTATPADAAALLAIYAPYVEKTAVSFEYDVPTTEVFAERIRRTLERYPYLVADMDGVPAGYAYAGAFHPRTAYDRAVETSLYIRTDLRRQGTGRLLYQALESILRRQGVLNLYACIAVPASEPDPWLTRDSADFHARLGYAVAGRFHLCGYKFGRWYDMIWMEKMLDSHPEQPLPFRTFPQLQSEFPDAGRPL